MAVRAIACASLPVIRSLDRRSSAILILPYYCEEEIDRYLRMLRALQSFERPAVPYEFLLAASPRTAASARLIEACQRLAPTTHFHCPTQVFGYPAGPTAMFWDCMDYVQQSMSGGPGFALWLESDMVIVKPEWLDRLMAEWQAAGPRALMLGCLVPEVHRRRWFRGPKRLLHEHINGGACYAKDFARRMPIEARRGVFDMAIYAPARRLGGAFRSAHIAFSTLERVRRDVLDPQKVILHGFMQDKDAFVRRATAPVTARERRGAVWHPWLDRIEHVQRQVRVCFVRRGPQAMLENLFLAQRRTEGSRRAA